MDAPDVQKLAVGITEASAMSALGRSTLYELMASGELTYVKIGSRRLILVESLRALLDAHRSPQAS